MPLYNDHVEAGTNSFGEPQIFCAHCHKPADYTTTTGASDTVLLELMCPSGAIQLGTGWANEQQRSADIRAFLAKNLPPKHS